MCCCTSEECEYKKRNHNDGHDDSLLNCNIGGKSIYAADFALIASRFSQTLLQENFARKWWLSLLVEIWNLLNTNF